MISLYSVKDLKFFLWIFFFCKMFFLANKTKSTNRNKTFEPNFLSIVSKVEDCVPANFIKLDSFVNSFPRKVCLVEQLFIKNLFLENIFYWILVNFGWCNHIGKAECLKKRRLWWAKEIIKEDTWRKKYLKKCVLKKNFCSVFFIFFIFHFDFFLKRQTQLEILNYKYPDQHIYHVQRVTKYPNFLMLHASRMTPNVLKWLKYTCLAWSRVISNNLGCF